MATERVKTRRRANMQFVIPLETRKQIADIRKHAILASTNSGIIRSMVYKYKELLDIQADAETKGGRLVLQITDKATGKPLGDGHLVDLRL